MPPGEHIGTLNQRQRWALSQGRDIAAALVSEVMDFGKGALLWLLGVPLPIILLLALFWHH
jgi:hypothetical protein